MAFVAAADLGGTLTKLAAAEPDGSLREVRRIPTLRRDDRVSIDWLGDLLAGMTADQPDRCAGYAVMVPGIIDTAARVVRTAANTGWTDVPLGRLLDEQLQLSGVVGHDVRAGGLAEWRSGAGHGADNLVFVPLGTGIAAALVVDGRLLESDGYAGELGHLRVGAAGDRRCGCGQFGCLETVASATGIVRTFERSVGRRLDAAEIAAWARAGDQAALQAFALANAALAEALAGVVGLLAPEVVVIGGGLSGAADLILPALTEGLAERLSFHRRPRLVTGTLGADAGLIGAGIAGWDRVGRPGAQS